MPNKQKKRADNIPKTPILHKKWSHAPTRLSSKTEFNAAGRIISVSLKNGVRYKGILGSVNVDSDMGLVLKMAMPIDSVLSNVSNQTNGLQHRIIDELIILPCDLMQIQVERVNFDEIVQQEQRFQTDSEIAGKSELKEKELHKWIPSNNDTAEFKPLEDSTQLVSDGEVWDQFAANEMLFGVKSEFDEDFYTTKVDKSHPLYKRREEEASRIAQEIQQSSTNNIHVAEERGFIQTDISEEAMYSCVIGSTVQPKDNFLEDKKEVDIVGETLTPQNHITSSQISEVETDISKQNSLVSYNYLLGKDKMEPSDLSPLSTTTKISKIETELMGTFKQFVSGERERLQAKKQALFKKEKDVKLQELLKFSQNFKLNTPVPSDLVPILSKDKTKHDEIVAKTSEESQMLAIPNKSIESTQYVQTASGLLPQNLDFLHGSQNTEKIPQKLNMKFNVKASIFKPNSIANSYTSYAPKTGGPTLDTSTFQSSQSTTISGPPDFFNNKKPEFTERKSILKDFDPFKRYRLEHPDNKHSSEKPYFFIPTWPCGEKSYKEMLHTLQQSMSLPRPGQPIYDSNEDYQAPYTDPNAFNFFTVPYGLPFYPTHQDASYGGVYNNIYRNFTSTQMIQVPYSTQGHLVKLLYMTPYVAQNMAYYPQYNIYMPPHLMNLQNYNSQMGQPIFGYPGSRNTPMMMQFYPGIQGQANAQQTVVMPMSGEINKTIQRNTYGYTG
ncbi:hypothetical protein PCANB_000307 [Pneumocystis canis]|nr:hypothetical protein PCANB_000307 [Pneumocystis canis]